MNPIDRVLIRVALVGLLVGMAGCDGAGVSEDYPCAYDNHYGGHWDAWNLELRNREPDQCPPDLKAGDVLTGGADVFDLGTADADFVSFEIHNSDEAEVGSAAFKFVTALTGERVAFPSTSYEIATGGMCYDDFDFFATPISAGEIPAWADSRVYYAGPTAVMCNP